MEGDDTPDDGDGGASDHEQPESAGPPDEVEPSEFERTETDSDAVGTESHDTDDSEPVDDPESVDDPKSVDDPESVDGGAPDVPAATPDSGIDGRLSLDADHETDDVDTADPDADDALTAGEISTDDIASGGTVGDDPDTGMGLDEVVLDDTDGDNQGLFDDLLSGEPIFENKEVLRPSYTPHELPHRKDQINQMATILVSALRGETPSNILIYGKTGTGKTASAKFVSQELESTSQKYDVPCEVEYINCEVTDTQYRVLAQLANKFIEKNQTVIAEELDHLRDLRTRATESDRPADAVVQRADATAPDENGDDEQLQTLDALDDRIADLESDADEMETVPMTGWPTDRVYSTFFDAVDYHERVVVIMLDEIDKLVEKSGDDTLYNLSRMNSELDNSRISIMGISNDLKFTDFLDPRVKSSLGEEEIVFPPYDANQLRDILQHRADVAFKGNALTEDVIPLCAAFAAQEHGDARRALDLLRTAGELAERSQADTVEESHVRQAQDKIELDRVVEVVRTLPTQSKIVLFAIILLEKNGVHNINTGEVFNIYKRLCEEIDADVLTQRRVTDLISELDMLGIVNAVVVSKGRYGRTKEISLSVPIDETEAVLLSDSRLGDIENAQPFVQARFDN
jgi:cell division control protein 6